MKRRTVARFCVISWACALTIHASNDVLEVDFLPCPPSVTSPRKVFPCLSDDDFPSILDSPASPAVEQKTPWPLILVPSKRQGWICDAFFASSSSDKPSTRWFFISGLESFGILLMAPDNTHMTLTLSQDTLGSLPDILPFSCPQKLVLRAREALWFVFEHSSYAQKTSLPLASYSSSLSYFLDLAPTSTPLEDFLNGLAAKASASYSTSRFLEEFHGVVRNLPCDQEKAHIAQMLKPSLINTCEALDDLSTFVHTLATIKPLQKRRYLLNLVFPETEHDKGYCVSQGTLLLGRLSQEDSPEQSQKITGLMTKDLLDACATHEDLGFILSALFTIEGTQKSRFVAGLLTKETLDLLHPFQIGEVIQGLGPIHSPEKAAFLVSCLCKELLMHFRGRGDLGHVFNVLSVAFDKCSMKELERRVAESRDLLAQCDLSSLNLCQKKALLACLLSIPDKRKRQGVFECCTPALLARFYHEHDMLLFMEILSSVTCDTKRKSLCAHLTPTLLASLGGAQNIPYVLSALDEAVDLDVGHAVTTILTRFNGRHVHYNPTELFPLYRGLVHYANALYKDFDGEEPRHAYPYAQVFPEASLSWKLFLFLQAEPLKSFKHPTFMGYYLTSCAAYSGQGRAIIFSTLTASLAEKCVSAQDLQRFVHHLVQEKDKTRLLGLVRMLEKFITLLPAQEELLEEDALSFLFCALQNLDKTTLMEIEPMFDQDLCKRLGKRSKLTESLQALAHSQNPQTPPPLALA
ncbi:MAG: hypothetical protein ACK5TR_04565 [Alphaproteobacteria bacterium]